MKQQSTDETWVTFRAACSALRVANAVKTRNAAFLDIQAFMSEQRHRLYVHRWRGWGLLFSNLIHIVQGNILQYLGIAPPEPGRGKKRKAQPKQPKLPKLVWWLYLRNEFDSAHKLDLPMLHMDPNGRECLTRLVAFSLQVINHGGSSAVDPSLRSVMGGIERAAWQTIELVVQHRVYCAVLAKDQLQDALEFALAAIDHGAASTSGFPKSSKGEGSNDARLLASVIHHILKNTIYDLHDWLPMLVQFLTNWLHGVYQTEANQSLEDVAPQMLAALTDVAMIYFTKVGPLILEESVRLLQFVKRMWKGSASSAYKRVHLLEFVVLFIQIFEYHADTLSLDGEISPRRLLREAQALLSIILDPKELHNLRLSARVSVHTAVGGPSGASSVGSTAMGFDLDASTVEYFSCSADIIYFHDRLLQRVSGTFHDTSEAHEEDEAMLASPAKRPRDVSSSMAWEQLINHIINYRENDDSASSSATASSQSSLWRERRAHQLQQQQARIQEKLFAVRLVMLLAVLRRHGDFYCVERIVDLETLVKEMAASLECKEIDQRQNLALHVLTQLAMFSTSVPDLKSEMFEGHWRLIWETLLRPDLPYAVESNVYAATDSTGELVFNLLYCSVTAGLVRRSVVASTSDRVWRLYRTTASSGSSAPLTSLGTPLSAAPIMFLASILQVVQPPSEAIVPTNDDLSSQEPSHALSVRSQLLQVVSTHIQAVLAQRELRSSDESEGARQPLMSAAYAAAVVSFLGVSPASSLLRSFLKHDILQPLLLRVFTDGSKWEDKQEIKAQLEGFGVHFVLQESGVAWIQRTHQYSKSSHHPDQFSAIIDMFRCSGTKQATTIDSESGDKFCRLRIPGNLARQHGGWSESKVEAFWLEQSGSQLPVSASREALKSSMAIVASTFTTMLNDLSTKLCACEPESPQFLTLLSSAMTVGLTLACMYSEANEALEAERRRESNDMVSLLCSLLKKFLSVFAEHFSAGMIDQARKKPTSAAVVIHLLRDFRAIILIIQGRSKLRHLKHPCADPLDLRIPSELRPAVRKITAAIEASLELELMEIPGAVPSQQHSFTSRSSIAVSSTQTSSSSMDWESTSHSISQAPPISAAPVGLGFDDDDDVSDQSVSLKVVYGGSLPPRILNIWSLRVILLLKKESGLKAVKKYTEDLKFEPDFLLAIASMLCGVCGCDSLDVLINALSEVSAEVGRGSQREDGGSSAMVVLANTEALRVLRQCALMHESRKRTHKEEIPQLLLAMARRFLAVVTSDPTMRELAPARRMELLAHEAFFRLNSEIFQKFPDMVFKAIHDVDLPVRFAAARSFQSLFYMYPDGCTQIFRDIHDKFGPYLPRRARAGYVGDEDDDGDTAGDKAGDKKAQGANAVGNIESCLTVLTWLYVCASSKSVVLPDALLVFLRLASATNTKEAMVYTQTTILHEWLDAIAKWYGYPSTSRLIDDHFSVLWSHHMKRRVTTNRVNARSVLQSFNISPLLGKSVVHGPDRLLPPDVMEVFKRHVDVILPKAVLHDMAKRPDYRLEDLVDEGNVDVDGHDLFTLVEEMSRTLLWCHVPPSSSHDKSQPDPLAIIIEEQLTTDLFALSFILHSSSTTNSDVADLATRMLAMAEAKATTYTLSIAHLGHVVLKMARFTVWDVTGIHTSSEVELSPSAEASMWARAMKVMKEKYSGFDWARMNLAELLSEFHELLLRSVYFEPLASRAIECFCLFVNEIKEAITSTTNSPAVLQHLLLHVLFATIKNVKRRDKPSSRRLTYLVREICDHLMTKSADTFGKYLNFVVHEIAGLLVSANRPPDDELLGVLPALDPEGKGNLEWIIFAICNNSATDLGKFMVDVDPVPSGVSSCLDKLNSMLSTSVGNQKTDRRRSVDNNAKKRSTSELPAVQQIEKFVSRTSQVGDRFYHSSRIVMLEGHANSSRRSDEKTAGKGTDSRLSRVREQVRTLLAAASSDNQNDGASADSSSESSKPVLAKLARALLSASTQYDSAVSTAGQDGVLLSIADTLGEIGVWNQHDFELNPSENSSELSRLYVRHFHRGALWETKAMFQAQMYEHLLHFLSSLLFESTDSAAEAIGSTSSTTAAVIYETLNSTKKVLRLDPGVNALAKCKDNDLKNFLDPFVSAPPSNWSTASAPDLQSASLSRLKALWRAHDSASFEDWVTSVSEAMAIRCADSMLRACAPLARHRTDMAVFIFPYALWAILKMEQRDPKTAAIVQSSIRAILTSAGSTNTRIVQLIIHTVNYLRETEKSVFVETNGQMLINAKAASTPAKKGSGDGNAASPVPPTDTLNQPAYGCLVDVDLLDVAAAAVRAKMPYSAMQFVEMWLERRHGGVLPSYSSTSDSTDNDRRARSILVGAYGFDDDVDGIYGVNDGRTFASQLVTYNREGNFTQALPLYDAMLHFDDRTFEKTEGSLLALSRLGYSHVLGFQLEALAGKERNTNRIQEHRYELAWKSLQWSNVELPTSAGSEDSQPPAYLHQRTLHQALKALAHRDLDQLAQLTRKAKLQILESSRSSLFGLESTRESCAALLHLQSITKIEEYAGQISNVGASTQSPPMLEEVDKRQQATSNDFDVMEALLSLEEVLVQIVAPQDRGGVLAKTYLSLSEQSRRAGRVAVAYKSLMKLDNLYNQGQLSIYDEVQWKMERAKLLWSQRETRSAIWVANQVQSEIKARFDGRGVDAERDTRLRMLYVASLTLTGTWIASQRSENSQVILQDHLQRATDIVDGMDEKDLKLVPSGVQDAAKAHLALAEYMAEMYHQVATRVSSREWLAGKRVAEARQRELAECLAMNETKQLENRAHIHALNKEVKYDFEERAKVENSVEQFLNGALKSFGRGLTLSSRSELAVVFRVISLWFNNHAKTSVNRVMQEIFENVPSYKFVPLSYQIISRVGSSSAASISADGGLFERALSLVILKLCEQHPHHALIQLIALKNSADVEGKGAHEFRTNVGDAKSESAKIYLEKLRKGPQRELLESLDVLSNAYVHLALFDTRGFHKSGKKIMLSEVKIPTGTGGEVTFEQYLRDRSRRTTGTSGTNRMVMPAVFTSSITPRPDMDYSSVSRVLSFDPKFSITDSGIHRPKIIYCHGSDGQRFKQLVKGKDDTRQDLVIEQVFDTVNQFLTEDHNTRKRNLRLRTYKVVPLSPIAGVLEWVDNTVPWGSYLVGRSGKRLSAHERYHPHEWKHADCRMHLKNAPNKFETYKKIEAHFTPVFHHFFLEKYPDAAMWYKRRLAFVQSAAVTSIVGYILGIGDRHSQNILIHEETAELVHIDFGVVFDQGMALFTPETVPFRLTRDLVDGMGVAGVEGVFTRCCEATLQLLRTKSASVVTILEVFVHDPLYRWTLSPLKALKIQEEGGTRANGTANETDGSVSGQNAPVGEGGVGGNNDAAARALIRVKQKLEGYEDPNGNALSIEGQVKQLISAAQDPRNLCALFPGWAPWL